MALECLSIYAPGHIDPADSYGLIASELIREISKLGIHVNGISRGNPRHSNQDEELRALTSKPLIPTLGGILLGYPSKYHEHGVFANQGKRIALTMFESSKIPKTWIEPLNEMDAVIVPSFFCRDVFQSCGVTVPIHVVNLGIVSGYTPKLRNPESPFTFLAFLDRGRRKGGLRALNAFSKTFVDNPDVRLIIKSRDISDVKKVTFDNKNIDVIYQDMSVQELNELYGSCHCLINAHMGEGFGLIPREFAATGGISLTTNWSATAENIVDWGFGINYHLEKATWDGIREFQEEDLGEWAIPDEEDLIYKMKTIYDSRKFYQDLCFYRAPLIKNKYNWAKTARQVVEIWRSVSDGSNSIYDHTEKSRVLNY